MKLVAIRFYLPTIQRRENLLERSSLLIIQATCGCSILYTLLVVPQLKSTCLHFLPCFCHFDLKPLATHCLKAPFDVLVHACKRKILAHVAKMCTYTTITYFRLGIRKPTRAHVWILDEVGCVSGFYLNTFSSLILNYRRQTFLSIYTKFCQLELMGSFTLLDKNMNDHTLG